MYITPALPGLPLPPFQPVTSATLQYAAVPHPIGNSCPSCIHSYIIPAIPNIPSHHPIVLMDILLAMGMPSDSKVKVSNVIMLPCTVAEKNLMAVPHILAILPYIIVVVHITCIVPER